MASNARGLLPTILQGPGQLPLQVVQPKASVAPRLQNPEPSRGQKDAVGAAQLLKAPRLALLSRKKSPHTLLLVFLTGEMLGRSLVPSVAPSTDDNPLP